MSGMETAGLVLGTIPLLISGLQQFNNVLKKVQKSDQTNAAFQTALRVCEQLDWLNTSAEARLGAAGATAKLKNIQKDVTLLYRDLVVWIEDFRVFFCEFVQRLQYYQVLATPCAPKTFDGKAGAFDKPRECAIGHGQ